LMLLMLKVATLTKSLSALYLWVRLPKGSTEFVGLALFYRWRNGTRRTKTHRG
jgi:hypothetical protein